MKKKLALLLAATMTMTLLPMNLFAATQNTITNVSYVVKNGTVFFEDNLVSQGAVGAISGTIRGDIRYAINGGSLVLYPQNGSQFSTNDSFQVKLTNGEWFFRNYDVLTDADATTDTATYGLTPYTAAQTSAAAMALGATDAGSVAQMTSMSGNYHGSFDGLYGTTGDKFKGAIQPTGNRAGAQIDRDYDTTKGLFFSVGTQQASAGVYVRTPQITGVNASLTPDVGYSMVISQADPTLATIKVYNVPTMGGLGRPASLVVPLAVFGANGGQDISVNILQGAQGSAPTPQQLPYAIGGGGGTTAAESTAPNAAPIIGRKTFVLNPIMIRENRIAALDSNGVFEIQAPDGFSFQDPNASPAISVTAEGGITMPASFQYAVGYNPMNTTNSTYDNSVLVVAVKGLGKSTALQGQLNINNIVLVADNDANFTDVNVKIVNRPNVANLRLVNAAGTDATLTGNLVSTDYNNDLGVSPQTLLVARRLNYSINFSASTAVPTLYSGRNNYNNDATGASSATAQAGSYNSTNYDQSQKAATVYFAELAQTSWWAQRETVFTLPTGVKFNQVYFHDTDNLTANGHLGVASYRGTDFDGITFKPSTQVSSSKDYARTGEGAGSNAVNEVEVTSDKITINSVDVDYTGSGTPLAEFYMDLWLSIASDFSGPVNLTCSGSGVPVDVAPLTIANAQAPVTVTAAKVSDVKIGYQYQPVSDVTITETGIGALLKGKTMRVSVSDMISADLSIDPHATPTVTGGDLKISNISTNTVGSVVDPTINANSDGGNAISFTIDRASSTSPATIVISNVAVKVNRDVPQTNYTPYKVVVWGDAIAQNFNTNSTGNKALANNDEFNVRGISADFIKVVSAANDASSVLTQEVRMPIGQSTFTINGVSSDMAATSYISTKSNSAMVPVRFVAQAFGLTADQIIWDQKAKTVTLMTPSGKVIQFKADSTDMVINQVVVPMLSLDTPPLPVAAEYDAAAGRVYIPFRALGNAFGVPVAFDTATNTAIYNAGANVTSTTSAQ